MMATTQRTVALAGVTLLAVVAAVAVGFGPATATALDERDAYDDPTAEFSGIDTNTVVSASSET